MLEGVFIKYLKLFHDDRGFLTEVAKETDATHVDFLNYCEKTHNTRPVFKQTTYTETHPGVIKAFHWHKKQWDLWFVIRGSAQVVLHDMRENSPTYKKTQTIFCGERNPLLIYIPPKVAHGYRVLGNDRVGLLYHTTETYDPTAPDEERIEFDDPEINFDWTTKNK